MMVAVDLLFKLTIFAAAPIEAGRGRLPFFQLRLAFDTQADARDCLAASLWDSRLAFDTMSQAFPVS